MRIGFVGLGSIGTGMAKRLLAAGKNLTVFARGQGLDVIRQAGAGTSDDYAALAADSDLLILCVYNDAQVVDILLERGALARMAPGSTVAIHTTGSPDVVRRVAAQAPEGVAVLDATFSGGPADAEAGTLTLMIGGDGAALERVRPILATYADKINHVGDVGHGQILKLLNNLLFATNLMHAHHIVKLAEAQGFEASQVARIIGSCSGASYGMSLFDRPYPSDAILSGARPYLEKDVAAAFDAARAGGLDVSAFDTVAGFFQPAPKG